MMSLDMNNLKVCKMVEKLEQTLKYKPKKIFTDPVKSKEWKPRTNTSIYTLYQIVKENPQLIKNNRHVKERFLASIPYAVTCCCEVTHERWDELEQKMIDANFFSTSEGDLNFNRLSTYVSALKIKNWAELENFFTEYFSQEILLDNKNNNNKKYEKVLGLAACYLNQNPHTLEIFLNASKKYIIRTLMKSKSVENNSENFFNYGNPYTDLEKCCLSFYIEHMKEADKIFEILVLQNFKKFFELKKRTSTGIEASEDINKVESAFKKINKYSKKFKEQNWKELNDLVDEYIDSLPEFVLVKAISEEKAFDEVKEQKVFEALGQKIVAAREVYAAERAARAAGRIQHSYYHDTEPDTWVDNSNYMLMHSIFNYVEDVVKNRCRAAEFFYINLNSSKWFDQYLGFLKETIKAGVNVDRT